MSINKSKEAVAWVRSGSVLSADCVNHLIGLIK